MSETDAAMEAALLKIAKDLLQASDDLASTDPQASAKLAHEAYEIGRDLGVVRNRVEETDALSTAFAPAEQRFEPPSERENAEGYRDTRAYKEGARAYKRRSIGELSDNVRNTRFRRRDVGDETETDADLYRILDRQKAMLPKPVEFIAAGPLEHDDEPMIFEAAPRRSGWFGWMRSREWRHAG